MTVHAWRGRLAGYVREAERVWNELQKGLAQGGRACPRGAEHTYVWHRCDCGAYDPSAFIRATTYELSLEDARAILRATASLGPPEATRAEQYIAATAQVTGHAAESLTGARGDHRRSRARHMAMWLISTHTDLTSTAIAALFRRHHTTVLSAVTKINDTRERDPVLREQLDTIQDLVLVGGTDV